MSTTPKVKLLTQPTDVIYSALFEGDTTRLLPKTTSFLIRLFGFLIFYGLFQLFEKLEKRINQLYSYKLGGDECHQGKQTSYKQWNIPMLNARIHVQDIDTRGKNTLPVKGKSSCEGKNGSAWLDMRQARAIRLKRNVRGAGIKLNKESKAHDNAFTT